MNNKKLTVVGLGYIGLPTAVMIANQGLSVNGMDINERIVENVKKGILPFEEPNLDKLLENVIENKKLHASTDIIEGDIYLIVVPTPFKGVYEPDISYVESATKNVIPLLKEEDLFIIESTSPVGTTEKMANLIFNARPELKDKIYIAYCPERVLPGNIVHELINNDRVIGGLNEESTEKAIEFYSFFINGQLHKTNARTAEMCKLTENSSRDVQIAFANELSIICDKAGINVWELIELANKHPRVNILLPGSGVGGHCIAVDPYFIVSEYPMEARLIGQAREINNYKAFWCIERINEEKHKFELKHGRKPKIACMGLAFKPNIDDLRESPAKYITTKVMQDIHDEEFYVVEPNLKEHNVFKLTNYKEAYQKADIVAFLVNHKEFSQLKYDYNKTILDFCGTFK